MGRSLNNALLNLDIEDGAQGAGGICPRTGAAGTRCRSVTASWPAARFLDSCASLAITGYGNSTAFHQRSKRSDRVPDTWLRNGNPWEIESPKTPADKFYGGTEHFNDDRAAPGAVDRFPRRARRALRYTDTRLSNKPSTRCACGKPRPPMNSIRRVQCGRLYRRGGAKNAPSKLHGALSQRHQRMGKELR